MQELPVKASRLSGALYAKEIAVFFVSVDDADRLEE